MIRRDTCDERSASSTHQLDGRWPSFHWLPPFEDYAPPSRAKTRLCEKTHGDPT